MTVNSSEAIAINLTNNGQPVFEDAFTPSFTYAIFGEEETIIGYKDLTINLQFRAHDMKPSLKIDYAEKIPTNAVRDEKLKELMDIEGKLADYLPESALNAEEGASNGSAANGTSKWTPPGELAHTYTSEGSTFQIWRSSLTDLRALEILANMRILVPFFIEGGTIGFLDEPAWSLERWKLFLLYEVSNPTPTAASDYTLAGFSTSYRLWVFPSDDITKMASYSSGNAQAKPDFSPERTSMPTPISPLDLLSRERISQFIILPPFQGQSHGAHLYNTMVSLFRSDPLCFEITVEEPNEQFDVLRDMNDMAYLHSQLPAFTSLSLPTQISQADLRRPMYVPDMLDSDRLLELRGKAKLAPRQFQRLVEIQMLSTIPKTNRNVHRITRKASAADENDRRYYFWRLMVKERLFVRNKDQLVQLEEEERVPKLEEIMPGVVEEYETRIEGFQKRVDSQGLLDIVNTLNGGAKKREGKIVPKKRKVVEDDDDDETEDSGVETKKSKLRASMSSRGKSRVVQTTSDVEEEGVNTLHE